MSDTQSTACPEQVGGTSTSNPAKGRKVRYTQVPCWLTDRVRPLTAAFALYLLKASFNDRVSRSRKQMATEFGCSVETVKRLTRELEAVGFLTRGHRKADHGGAVANVLRIHFEGLGRSEVGSPETLGGVSTDPTPPIETAGQATFSDPPLDLKDLDQDLTPGVRERVTHDARESGEGVGSPSNEGLTSGAALGALRQRGVGETTAAPKEEARAGERVVAPPGKLRGRTAEKRSMCRWCDEAIDIGDEYHAASKDFHQLCPGDATIWLHVHCAEEERAATEQTRHDVINPHAAHQRRVLETHGPLGPFASMPSPSKPAPSPNRAAEEARWRKLLAETGGPMNPLFGDRADQARAAGYGHVANEVLRARFRANTAVERAS